MILTLANQKGGVGKTTLAVNLGCILAETTRQRVVILDPDPQESAVTWSEMGKLPVQVHRGGDARSIQASFVIADTPGNLHSLATQKSIQAADIVVVPCGSSPQDIEPTKRTIAVVKELTPSPCLLVLNRIREGTITLRGADAWSKTLGVRVANTRLHSRQIFEQMVCRGWVSRGPGNVELQRVLIEILNLASRGGNS